MAFPTSYNDELFQRLFLNKNEPTGERMMAGLGPHSFGKDGASRGAGVISGDEVYNDWNTIFPKKSEDTKPKEMSDEDLHRMWVDDETFVERVIDGLSHVKFLEAYSNARKGHRHYELRVVEDLLILFTFLKEDKLKALLKNPTINELFEVLNFSTDSGFKVTLKKDSEMRFHSIAWSASRPARLFNTKENNYQISESRRYEIEAYEFVGTPMGDVKKRVHLSGSGAPVNVDEKQLDKVSEVWADSAQDKWIEAKKAADKILYDLLDNEKEIVKEEGEQKNKALSEEALEAIPNFGKYR